MRALALDSMQRAARHEGREGRPGKPALHGARGARKGKQTTPCTSYSLFTKCIRQGGSGASPAPLEKEPSPTHTPCRQSPHPPPHRGWTPAHASGGRPTHPLRRGAQRMPCRPSRRKTWVRERETAALPYAVPPGVPLFSFPRRAQRRASPRRTRLAPTGTDPSPVPFPPRG